MDPQLSPRLDTLVYCSGECGSKNGGKKGQGGVGLAVKSSVTRAVLPPEFISDQLVKVTLELRGPVKSVAFIVAYAPTETHDASDKNAFWTTLGRAVENAPKHEQLFALKDAYVVRGGGRREKWGARTTKSSVPTAKKLSTIT